MTTEAKARLKEIFEGLGDEIYATYIADRDMFRSLEPNIMFKLYTDILPYIVPKVDSVSSGESTMMIAMRKALKIEE